MENGPVIVDLPIKNAVVFIGFPVRKLSALSVVPLPDPP